MSQIMERRLVIECAWCRKKQLIPTEWCGRVIECIHCGEKGRAYGYLSAPERVQPESPHRLGYMIDPDIHDYRGGLFTAMAIVAGLWVVARLHRTLWFWF